MPTWKIVKSPHSLPATATRCRSFTNISNNLSALTWPSCRYAKILIIMHETLHCVKTINCMIQTLDSCVVSFHVHTLNYCVSFLLKLLNIFAGDSSEQQGFQFCAIPSGNCFWAVIWSDLCRHRREVHDWSQPMFGTAFHPACGCLLWIRANKQGCSVFLCSKCSRISQNYDQEVSRTYILRHQLFTPGTTLCEVNNYLQCIGHYHIIKHVLVKSFLERVECDIWACSWCRQIVSLHLSLSPLPVWIWQ